MSNTAVIHFSGICTHLKRGDDRENHKVVIADVSDPATYAGHSLLADLPPHTARLIVNSKNVVNKEDVLRAASEVHLPFAVVEDSWSWKLSGIKLAINVTPKDPASPIPPPEPLSYAEDRWRIDVPSLQAHAPRAAGGLRPLDDEAAIESRAAAILEIASGELVPVDYDERTGGAAVQWRFPVTEEGVVQVSFSHLPGGETVALTLRLAVPAESKTGPVEPLIQIENIGTTKDDERDFLFHYYALFNDVPPNARPPKNLGFVDSGTGAGCSNSSYP